MKRSKRTILAISPAARAGRSLYALAVLAVCSRGTDAGEPRTAGGTIAEDTLWTAAGGPLLVTDDVLVPSGVRLVVEAGAEIRLEPNVDLDVEGELVAVGTEDAPILFTAMSEEDYWGNVRFEGEDARGELAFCEITRSEGDPGAITLEDSTLAISSCHIHDIDGEGVHAVGGSVTVRHTLVERTEEALSLDEGLTVVEFCTLRFVVGDSDLCDVNRARGAPARIAFNHLYGTEDDGIDADDADIDAEGNVIHDCGDQAFSLVGDGTSRVVGNVVFGNTHGLSVKDGHACVAEFNTIVNNLETGVRAIEDSDDGGGGTITLSSSIVWGNGDALLVNADGSIETRFCDIEGLSEPGEGDFEADPLFVDTEAGDFRLLAESPCRGAAEDGSDVGALPFDGEVGERLLARGDVDADGERTVTDAVFLLNFLFLGTDAPVCDEVARINGDARIDLADAVFLLNFLFLGGSPPSPADARCEI